MSTPEFVAPFFYFTDDVYSFESLEALLLYIEPWDVRSTDRGFDSEGRRVVLSGGAAVRRRFWVGGGETVLDIGRSGETATGEFKELLKKHLRSSPRQLHNLDDQAVEQLSLDGLIATVHPRTRDG